MFRLYGTAKDLGPLFGGKTNHKCIGFYWSLYLIWIVTHW